MQGQWSVVGLLQVIKGAGHVELRGDRIFSPEPEIGSDPRNSVSRVADPLGWPEFLCTGKGRGDRRRNVPAADGLEAVRKGVAGIPLPQPCVPAVDCPGLPFVLGREQKAGVVRQRRCQVRVAIEATRKAGCDRKARGAAGLAGEDALGEGGASPGEGADVDRVLGLAADRVHRQGSGPGRAAEQVKVAADLTLIHAGCAIDLIVAAPLRQAADAETRSR